MADAAGAAELEAELRLPAGGTIRLVGDAADTSVVGSIAAHGGAYEPGLLEALTTLVGSNAVCLDVGANVGPVTLALSRLCPAGTVHAFEPTMESFDFLSRNIALNNAANVRVHRLALLDEVGEFSINYDPVSSGAAFISDHLAAGTAQVVQATTLDKWASEEGLERLDLVKIDVEGSEGKVLDGAAATLDRFRPTLVVELNPITIRRMQHGDPRALFERLRSLYGGSFHLAAVPDSGPMVPVVSWRQVARLIAESGLCNLVCSERPLVPGRHAGVAGPVRAGRRYASSLRRHNRLLRPPWAALYEPRVDIRVDPAPPGRPEPLRGRPGEEIDVPLRVTNLGRETIVGEAARFAVSMRVVWIGPAGDERPDDRSRLPAPTLRPHAGAQVLVPLYLPDSPGRHTARITLFQEDVAWFYDLDPANCCELPVDVAADEAG